jgi:hypothetical protein
LDCYAPFNPDADTQMLYISSEADLLRLQKNLVKELSDVLNAANFERITAEDLKEALAEESLFKIRFMKTLADNLYFKNLDNNAGVLFHLINEAEEEDFKEAMLAYYFLLTDRHRLSQPELDDKVEQWLADQFRNQGCPRQAGKTAIGSPAWRSI